MRERSGSDVKAQAQGGRGSRCIRADPPTPSGASGSHLPRRSSTEQGSPQARLRRAIATGNPTIARATALELPRVELVDALALCLLFRDRDPERYERAAVRTALPRGLGPQAGRRAARPVRARGLAGLRGRRSGRRLTWKGKAALFELLRPRNGSTSPSRQAAGSSLARLVSSSSRRPRPHGAGHIRRYRDWRIANAPKATNPAATAVSKNLPNGCAAIVCIAPSKPVLCRSKVSVA